MKTITKAYNVIIDVLLIILLGIGFIMTFALEPKGSDEHFIAFIGLKIGCMIITALAYYGLRERGILDRLSV